MLDIPSQGALFVGSNGSGKTNILEAIHVLCTSRSQRGVRRRDMILAGEDYAFVKGRFVGDTGSGEHETAIGFDRLNRCSVQRDGEKVGTIREWFGNYPVVSFGPDDVRLVYGPPSQRRRFLDMLISQCDPSYLDALMAYRKTLQNRNKLLSVEADEEQCEVYEYRMADAGAYLYEKRVEITALCQEWFTEFYMRIVPEKERVSLRYNPCVLRDFTGNIDWKNVFYNSLKRSRKNDRKRGYTTVGPHRDDISFFIDSMPAKIYGSQGQCRSMALAIRLCSIRCIERFKKERMLFLVDDAFSELDEQRMRRILPLLQDRGQVIMTTPLHDLPLPLDVPRFSVEGGTVTRQ
jgi:DNA replication and repair protein RecF